jgi:hypothetical protein
MADSAENEEHGISPTSHAQRPESSKQLNIAGNGKAVNAAMDGIQIHEQRVDIAGAAKKVNMDNRSTRVANTEVNNSASPSINIYLTEESKYNSMYKPYPRDDSAAFLYTRRRELIPRSSHPLPPWDETIEGFSHQGELEHRRMIMFVAGVADSNAVALVVANSMQF